MAIWASDFIVSGARLFRKYDQVLDQPLWRSAERRFYKPHRILRGTGNLVVQIWAYDGAGNTDVCETMSWCRII